MATSGSTDFSVSRDDIIKRALRIIGVLAQGETPTTNQTTEAAVALNGLVKAWEAAHWLINVIKWVGIIAGSVMAFFALIKGNKP